jgi:hypothetical protein
MQNRAGVLFEMEKLLIRRWRIKNKIPLNRTTIQGKIKSHSEHIKVNMNDPEANFMASNG